MSPTKYICPRCRAEQADHDCAQPEKSFELHATLSFPVPLYSLDRSDPHALARQLIDEAMTEPGFMLDMVTDALHLGDYVLDITPEFVDPA